MQDRFVDLIKDEDLEQIFRVHKNNKIFTVAFDKVVNIDMDNDNKSPLFAFAIPKQAHYNNAEMLVKYANYFCQYYDPEKDYILGCLRMKALIDLQAHHISFNLMEFIRLMDMYIFNDRVLDKIEEMVDYNNVLYDYEAGNFSGDESLKFNNTHCRVGYNVSLAFKLITPMINHYIYIKGYKGAELDDTFYNIFIYIADKFRRKSGIDIISKLYVNCLSKNTTAGYKNKELFEKRFNIYGKSTSTLNDKCYSTLIISIIPKFIFSSSMLSLVKVVIETIIEGEKNWKTPYVEKEIDEVERDSDGLSNLDKIEINTVKEDESRLMINQLMVAEGLQKLQMKYGEVDYDEMSFYMNNLELDVSQLTMISLLFAKDFGSTGMIRFMKKNQYAILIAIMKRMLSKRDFIVLQHLMSGKVVRKNKKKLNLKTTKRIEPRYRKILEEKFHTTKSIIDKSQIIEIILAFLLHSDITMLDYEYQNLNGDNISQNVHPDIIVEEILRFINLI